MSIVIVNFFILNAARKSDEVLEPDERKHSRPVLRGERARKRSDLLGDIQLSQRDLSYTTIPDLREKFHPGQELLCRLKAYDKDAAKLVISVKEVKPNPFFGADKRHPVGSRRQATISGKYAGGVFCTLPDDTVCLCLYSSQHSDADFCVGNSVIVAIRQYDYGRQLIYGRILAKW